VKIIVTGMHRSGTSAVAGLIAAAGIPAGDHERTAIRDANDRILAELGWSWDAPPPVPPAFPDDRPAAVTLLRTLVAAELGDGPWLVGDPRIALLLPIWRRVVADRCILVVTERPIDEIARSLGVRDDLPVAYCRALARAYARHLAAGAAGLPIVRVDYPGLIGDPVGTARALVGELAALGGALDPARADAAASTIDPLLDRSAHPAGNEGDHVADRRAVAVVDAAALDAPADSDEDEALLELRRRQLAALRLANEREARGEEARTEAEIAEVELAWMRLVADEARAARRAAEAEVRRRILEAAGVGPDPVRPGVDPGAGVVRPAWAGAPTDDRALLRELLLLAGRRPGARLRTLALRVRLRLGLPNPLFDAAWYRASYPDVPGGPGRAWIHWRRHGWREGRDPGATFRTTWYRTRNPDVVEAGGDPLAHYLLHGWIEGRDPSPHVHGDDYLRHYPDVAAAAICPLLHHRRHGAAEGRTLAHDRIPRG